MIQRVWFDAVSLDCDDCASTDGSIRVAYRCPVDCGEASHVATVCVSCHHLTLSTSHAQPVWLRGELRRRALETIREARP